MTRVTRRHPTKNQRFTSLEDGLVEVADLDTGKTGIFRGTGRWVSGDLKFADPHMLEWMGSSSVWAGGAPDPTPNTGETVPASGS